MNNQKGFTLLEVMVSMALIGALSYFLVGSSGKIMQDTQVIRHDLALDKVVQRISDNVRENIDLYQITYNQNEFLNKTTKDELDAILPLAWDSNVYTTKEGCPSCPGRAGFIITPIDGYRGLYRVIIRITHTELITGGDGYKDFVFLVKSKI